MRRVSNLVCLHRHRVLSFAAQPAESPATSLRKMPAFDKDALSDADIDAVIAWLSYKAKT
jgi:mono/diheme cytochrome c family protein